MRVCAYVFCFACIPAFLKSFSKCFLFFHRSPPVATGERPMRPRNNCEKRSATQNSESRTLHQPINIDLARQPVESIGCV